MSSTRWCRWRPGWEASTRALDRDLQGGEAVESRAGPVDRRGGGVAGDCGRLGSPRDGGRPRAALATALGSWLPVADGSDERTAAMSCSRSPSVLGLVHHLVEAFEPLGGLGAARAARGRRARPAPDGCTWSTRLAATAADPLALGARASPSVGCWWARGCRAGRRIRRVSCRWPSRWRRAWSRRRAADLQPASAAAGGDRRSPAARRAPRGRDVSGGNRPPGSPFLGETSPHRADVSAGNLTPPGAPPARAPHISAATSPHCDRTAPHIPTALPPPCEICPIGPSDPFRLLLFAWFSCPHSP